MARILVVEDDPIQLEMRRQILEHAGYEVVAAQNASEALERFAGCPVVVMDLRIPEPEDGLRLIQALAGKARIIVLSGGQVDPRCRWTNCSPNRARPSGCWKASKNGPPRDLTSGETSPLKRIHVDA